MIVIYCMNMIVIYGMNMIVTYCMMCQFKMNFSPSDTGGDDNTHAVKGGEVKVVDDIIHAVHKVVMINVYDNTIHAVRMIKFKMMLYTCRKL